MSVSARVPVDDLACRLLAYGEFAELDGRASDLNAPNRAVLSNRIGLDRRSHLDGARDAAAEQALRRAGFPAAFGKPDPGAEPGMGEQPTRLGRLRAALRPFRRASFQAFSL